MPKQIDIREFAQRVERLCDFLLGRLDKADQNDLRVIQDLREDAANIQFDRMNSPTIINGLNDYIRSMPLPEDTKEQQ